MFQQPRLSDGRRIRALPGLYTQSQMFGLHRSGQYHPAHESIMGIRDLDDACNSGAWSAPAAGCWRSGRYGVHARGFEVLDRPIGSSVTWVEAGLPYLFEIPDVRHPADRSKGLKDACGLLDFALGKLVYDESARKVSASQDFDPEDIVVREIRRARGWALPNGGGYPSRSMPSSADIPEARLSAFACASEFEGSASGWHGSIIFGDAGRDGDYRLIGAGFWEAPSSVGLVSLRHPSGPLWTR